MRAPSVGVECVWLGSQAFQSASAFNANIGSWNVLRVSTPFDFFAFGSTGLSCANKLGLHSSWGSTFQAAYPTFAGICTPIVSSFKPLNAQVSGAYTVTVFGKNFEPSDMTPSAYVSGQPCATTTWTTDTQLVCTAPAAVLAGDVGREAWVKVLSDTASRGFSFDGTDACV
jgi:hypothetical protein